MPELPHRNPLPQLIPARLRHLQRRVEEQLWKGRESLEVMISDEQHEPLSSQQAARLSFKSLSPGEFFGRGGDQWTQFWMRIDLDEGLTGDERYLLWRCQGETTVWIDDRPWAGLDLGHRECPLPNHACTLWLECNSWQTGIWISMIQSESIGPHGLLFDGAEVGYRDTVAWDCHCDLDVIAQLVEHALHAENDLQLAENMGYCRALETATPRLRRLLAGVNVICDVWQLNRNLEAVRAACQQFLQAWPAEDWQPTAAVCGHAHIDLVWLWPESATRKKVVHTFATLMRTMERYPEMTFTQSMPALYRMLEQDSPALMQAVQRHIQDGRWEVLGAFEVEPDTNLPGGEALARSLAVGQRKIHQLTGNDSQVAWIPDVFGYSQCLPQLMALAGVKYFYTTKMTWSKITKFPYTSFVWRGGDGTEVLSHLGTTDYNGEVDLQMHDRAMSQHRQVAQHPELLLPTGYGDGGGGPTELHIERAKRMANLSGAARTAWTRVDDFFARLDAVRDTLPVYQGELYLEYHRGTYTTQSEFKRLYRRAEQGLQMHEAVRVALNSGPLPDSSWQRLLFSHFHDAIPGSSIGKVYEDMNDELASIGDREFALAEQALSSRPGTEFVFNSLPFERRAVVVDQGTARQVDLPAMGAEYFVDNAKLDLPIRDATPKRLAHDRLEACFDDCGQLSGLTIDGQPLALTSVAGFVISPDDPAAFDAWDIDHDAARLGLSTATHLKLTVVEHTPVRAVLESESVAIGEESELRLRYILESGCLHLKVVPTIQWRESHRLLRYVIATAYRGRWARFGCPFGSIERPQLAGTESDEAMWEVPGSRWAAVQYDGGVDGLAIIAESKLGYFARDGVLGVSLLRAPKWPDETADLGIHTTPFAIGRLGLQTTADGLSTAMAADALFTPPLVTYGKATASPFRWIDLGTLAASWCGPSQSEENGYFIRLHEIAGRPGTARLMIAHRVAKAELVDLLERPVETLSVHPNGTLEFAFRPGQILTLRITAALDD